MAYATAAADAGNVTVAARRLSVSQPSISAAIAALETHYGQPLFVRLPGQGVEATGFGLDVLRQMRAILDQVDAVATIAAPGDMRRGAITIACYEALAPYLLPGLLNKLAETMPGLTVRFIEATLEGVAEAVGREKAEFGLSYDLGAAADITVKPIYDLQPRILCAAGHRFARRKSVRLAELDGEDLILLDQPMSAQYVLGLLRASGAALNVAARVKGFELQRAFVANGLGVALTHTIPKANVAYDGQPLAVVPIRDDLPPQKVLLMRQKRQTARSIVDRAEAEILNALRAV